MEPTEAHPPMLLSMKEFFLNMFVSISLGEEKRREKIFAK
jgi:hypothetical protein